MAVAVMLATAGQLNDKGKPFEPYLQSPEAAAGLSCERKEQLTTTFVNNAIVYNLCVS